MSIGIRRLAIASSVAICVVGSSLSPAWAGDQKIVDKGIGFLEGIQSKVSNESCAAYRKDLLGEGLQVPITRDEFLAYVENNGQIRRDWIEKQSGGMTPAQRQQLEDALQATRPIVVNKAEECGFHNMPKPEAPKPEAPKPEAPAPAVDPTVYEDTPSVVAPSPVATTNTTTTTTTTTTDNGDIVGTLNQLNQNLEVLNKDNKNTPAPTPSTQGEAAAPAKVYTQLLIPNPMDPAHPFVIVIPPFIPQNMVAGAARSLPAGWQLR